MTKGDIFGMRDGIVYCRLHYEMLTHPSASSSLQQQQQHHHHHTQHGLMMNNNNSGLMSGTEGPCDLSCGPHHGLLPPSGFHVAQHHHHLMPPESVSPNQHMINILSSSSSSVVDVVGESPFPSALRPSGLFGGGGGGQHASGSDYLHNPSSANDFQRCLTGQTNPNSAAGFFSSLPSGGSGLVGASSPGTGSIGHHVQKGRPRKRKIPNSASSAASLHSNNNNNNSSSSNNNNNSSMGIPVAGNHSDSSVLMGQQLNAANLRQLNSGLGECYSICIFEIENVFLSFF